MNRLTSLVESTLLTTLMGIVSINPLVPVKTVVAQSPYSQRITLPVGTTIPVRYPQADMIRVPKGKTQKLTLEVATSIQDDRGNIVIPVGSEINGQLEPTGNGVRFVAQELRINQSEGITLNAVSPIVTTTEIEKRGASTTDIIVGTVAGAGAATIIAGTTGDRRIKPLEVLAGAGLGTLAGWGLPQSGVIGGKDQEVIVIKPQRDLTLRLQRQLTFESLSRAKLSSSF
jgi:hypothetical protein